MITPVWILEKQQTLTKIAYCATHGKFVIGSGTSLVESATGYNFTTRTFTPTDSINGIAGTDVVTNRGRIVVTTSTPNIKIYEMADTGVWSDVTPVLSGTFSQIVYQPGIGFFVLGVRLGNPVNWLSTDGVTWSGPYTHHIANSTVRNGTVGFMCIATTAVDFSPDGVGWTLQSTGLGTKLLRDLCYVPGLSKWIGVATDVGQTNTWIVQCDADGTNFTVIHTFGSYISPTRIFFEPGTGDIVIITSLASNATYASTDGITWFNINTIDPLGFSCSQLAVIAGKMICLGLSNSTWSPNDNIMAMMVRNDYAYNGYLDDGFSVNSALNPPTSPVLVENSPGDFNFQFTLPTEPAVQTWNVVRVDNSGNAEIVGVILNTSGPQDIHDVTTAGTYTYSVFGVDAANQNLTTTASAANVTPDITIVGAGGVALGGSATIVLEADPSGLYTLTPGKTHDTLYDRLPAGTTVDVPIPNPFFKTGYIGEN